MTGRTDKEIAEVIWAVQMREGSVKEDAIEMVDEFHKALAAHDMIVIDKRFLEITSRYSPQQDSN